MPNPVTPYSASYGTLQAAVAPSGTLTVNYPAGTTQATFSDGSYAGLGTVITNRNNTYSEAAGTCAFSYGASNITITNTSTVPWGAGDLLDYGMGRAGYNYNYSGKQTPASAVTDIPSVVKALTKAGILY